MAEPAELAGFFNVYKPAGMRSTQVVSAVRRMVGTRQVGHCGTLDPLAEGVLPIAVGRATKLADYVHDGPKTYFACVLFGVATGSDDLEGAPDGDVHPSPELAAVKSGLATFVGTIQQRPPAMSAVHVDGERAYRRARRGESVEVPLRSVTIHEAFVVSHGTLPVRVDTSRLHFGDHPIATDALIAGIFIRCSSGTYIRSLARDLGERVGTRATMFGLVRLAAGPFQYADAIEIWQLEIAARDGYLDALIFPPDYAVEHFPGAVLGAQETAALGFGQRPSAPAGMVGAFRVYDTGGQFVGLADAKDGTWRTRTLFLAT